MFEGKQHSEKMKGLHGLRGSLAPRVWHGDISQMLAYAQNTALFFVVDLPTRATFVDLTIDCTVTPS